MKFLVFIVFGLILYFVLDTLIRKTHYKKFRKWLAPAIFVFMLTLAVVGAVHAAVAPDIQCGKAHNLISNPPVNLNTANDYLLMGDYQYDLGDCEEAVNNYTQAISLNSNFAEAFNNRGYAYMRMRVYDKALKDLDKAIEIRPTYVHALMNRGDIYNYYFEIDRSRAIEDYNKVLALVKDNGQRQALSVCGHKLLAENNGWSTSVYLHLILNGGINSGCN